MRRLFDAYAPMLMTLAGRYIPDRNDVQDVVQTSFISIFKHFNTFYYRGPGSLVAWMRRITVHTALSWLRKQKRLHFVPLLDTLSDENSGEDPEYKSISQETLYDAIRSLPDGYRTVLNLYVFENLNHKEIGSLLGISEGTSASQLHRAKALLFKKLKGNLS